MSKRREILLELIANYVGRVWKVLANFIFVPLYVYWLGAESYGVVAFAMTIQSAATLLDFGLSTTVSREIARRTAMADSETDVRNLVRTLEVIYWSTGLVLCGALLVAADPISTGWLTAKTLAPDVIRHSLMLASLSIAFSWPVTFYMGMMMGLNRQVPFNVVSIIGTTLRFGGTALCCAIFPHNLVAFFSAQAVTAGFEVAALAVVAWRYMPKNDRKASFEMALLKESSNFVKGMTLANGAALLFTQVDKVILSKLLPLDQFAYYSLAWTLAGIFYLFYAPVSLVFLPRFSAAQAIDDHKTAARLYHLSCQLVALGALPTAFVLTFFPNEVLSIWTYDEALVAGTAPLLRLLIPFAAVGCIGYMPAVFQWANGWTSLTTKTYVTALIVVIPAIIAGYVSFGVEGAIVAWGIVRLCQTVAQIELMHTRLLPTEKWRSYRDAVIRPIAAALLVSCAARVLLGNSPAGVERLVIVWVACALAIFLGTPLMRTIAEWQPNTPRRVLRVPSDVQ